MKEKRSRYIPLFIVLLISIAFAKLHFNKRSGGNDICYNICCDAGGTKALVAGIITTLLVTVYI